MMHHIKFEKNWISGYEEGVKNVQMWTDTTYHVWARHGGKTSTPRMMKFTILVDTFLLYITMHLVFLTYMQFQRRRFFLTIGQFWHFLPRPKGPRVAGNLKFTIYAPLSQRCSISNLKRIGAVVIKRKLKMFKC
jgi:hypothetical protein